MNNLFKNRSYSWPAISLSKYERVLVFLLNLSHYQEWYSHTLVWFGRVGKPFCQKYRIFEMAFFPLGVTPLSKYVPKDFHFLIWYLLVDLPAPAGTEGRCDVGCHVWAWCLKLLPSKVESRTNTPRVFGIDLPWGLMPPLITAGSFGKDISVVFDFQGDSPLQNSVTFW